MSSFGRFQKEVCKPTRQAKRSYSKFYTSFLNSSQGLSTGKPNSTKLLNNVNLVYDCYCLYSSLYRKVGLHGGQSRQFYRFTLWHQTFLSFNTLNSQKISQKDHKNSIRNSLVEIAHTLRTSLSFLYIRVETKIPISLSWRTKNENYFSIYTHCRTRKW